MAQQAEKMLIVWHQIERSVSGAGEHIYTAIYMCVCVCVASISCTVSQPSLLTGRWCIAQPVDLTDGTSASRIDLGGLVEETERWRTVSGVQSHSSQGPRRGGTGRGPSISLHYPQPQGH